MGAKWATRKCIPNAKVSSKSFCVELKKFPTLLSRHFFHYTKNGLEQTLAQTLEYTFCIVCRKRSIPKFVPKSTCTSHFVSNRENAPTKMSGHFAIGFSTPHIMTWNRLCLLYTSPSPRDLSTSRMPSSA